jgi:hypothetical protein
MSGDGNTNYTISMMTGGIVEPEYLLYKLFRQVPGAKHYLNEYGTSTGNGYDWRTLVEDLRTFSAHHPDVLVVVAESGTYDGERFDARHYFKAGAYARIEPEVVVRWPEFNEGMLA